MSHLGLGSEPFFEHVQPRVDAYQIMSILHCHYTLISGTECLETSFVLAAATIMFPEEIQGSVLVC